MTTYLQYLINPTTTIPSTDVNSGISTINFFSSLPQNKAEYNKPLIVPKNVSFTSFESWYQPVVLLDTTETQIPNLIKITFTGQHTLLNTNLLKYTVGVAMSYTSPAKAESNIAKTPITNLSNSPLVVPILSHEGQKYYGAYLVFQMSIASSDIGYLPLDISTYFKFDIITLGG